MILMIPLTIAYGLLLLGAIALWVLAWKFFRLARDWRSGVQKVGSFFLHPGLYYHRGHTWVMPQRDGTVRIGLDDFGRRIVDGIRKVELPPKGATVVEGEVAVHLKCGKRQAKLLSPVDGVIVEVNESLMKGGALPDDLERDPYGDGWLFTVRVSDRKFANLPTGTSATDWLRWEEDRLSHLLHQELGVMAADGGDLISRPASLLGEESWATLTRTFFHAE